MSWDFDGKPKRRLTAAQRAARKRRRAKFMTIFINGKQKRVPRPPMIDGMDVDEFIRRNAGPIWLLQNEMWEELHRWEQESASEEDYDWMPETSFSGPVSTAEA